MCILSRACRFLAYFKAICVPGKMNETSCLNKCLAESNVLAKGGAMLEMHKSP